MATIIETLQFKRGEKANLELVLVGSNKPKAGEPIWESDTNKLKIGNGVNDYADLPYLAGGEDSSQLIRDGYYDAEHDIFYKDETHYQIWTRLISKIYLDIPSGFTYYLKDNAYTKLIGQATSTRSGLVKLYNGLGQNEDGTVTQKSLTSEFDKKCEITGVQDECIIFKANI